MNSRTKVLALAFAIAWAFCPCSLSGGSTSPRDRLQALATAAQNKKSWPELRELAASAPDTETRGEAYFVLGYREYEAGQYSQAADDIAAAGRETFSLADYADYYRAAALVQVHRDSVAADVLDGFGARHPDSDLKLEALVLEANAALRAGQAERAVRVLESEPETQHRPNLDLLLAEAEQRAGNLENAAKSYQQIYYNSPTFHEAKAAGDALKALTKKMGARFPMVSAELATIRAKALFDHDQYKDALKEYTTFLKQHPESPLAPRWEVEQARCWLRMKRTKDAMAQLQTSIPSDRAADAERLATLVEAYIQRDNMTAMREVLEKLQASFSDSPSYAEALNAAGNHLVRQGDWKGAARIYELLEKFFPETQLGEEANWRVAWSLYLQRDRARAREMFVDNASRYPDSPHVVADFYWLGRLAEQSGDATGARAFYDWVEQRWATTYYADSAKRRSAALKTASAASDTPDWQSLADDLARKVPQPRAPADICESLESAPALRPYLTLTFLGLEQLAEQYLRELLRQKESSPGASLELSRIERERGDYNRSVIDAGRAVPDYYDFDFSQLPAELWSLLYPTAYWAVVEREARVRSVDPYLVMGLIRQESAFNPRAVSPAKARGLMQLLVPTARTRKGGRGANARRLYDPVYNVHLGSDYLQHLLELNQGVFEQAMAAYHAGEDRVSAWLSENSFRDPAEFLESIPIPATRVYVEKVVRDATIYHRLMADAPTFRNCH